VFAIATYERTLVADQTPWDDFIAGDVSALTPAQQTGWTFFAGSPCNTCHVAPLFTDNSFRNIGVRDPMEDTGREEATGAPADLGRFKVPTLRNAGLKPTLFHTGDAETMPEVVTFYQPGNQGSVVNIDPLMPVPVPPNLQNPLSDFLANGLVDPRVAAETFPFDRPILVPEPMADGLLVAGATLLLAFGRQRAARRRAESAPSSGSSTRVIDRAVST
jgi:cytochrome c peroxidase